MDASDSVGGAHGTVMGGAAFTATGELSFDGVNDFVDLPDRILSGLEEISLEAWHSEVPLTGFLEKLPCVQIARIAHSSSRR